MADKVGNVFFAGNIGLKPLGLTGRNDDENGPSFGVSCNGQQIQKIQGHNPSKIEEKKKEAQAQAMKIVSDAFDGEKKIDESVQKLKDENAQSFKDRAEKLRDMKNINERINELQDMNADDPMAQETLKELQNQADMLQKDADQMLGSIQANNSAVTQIGIDRLKNHTMIDAQDAADEMMEAAYKSIALEAVTDARKKMEEEQAKKEEAAEKKAKEEKEQQEKIDKSKLEREKAKLQAEKAKAEADASTLQTSQPVFDVSEEQASAVSDVTDLSQKQVKINLEIEEILDKMKLLEEDIKGSSVDSIL